MKRRLITKADLPLSPEKLEEVREFCFLEENRKNVRVICKGSGRLPKVLTQDWTDESLPIHDRAHKHINVNPREWRMALQEVCVEGVILEYVDNVENDEKFENTHAVMMWRAALAFSHELDSYGIKQCHIDLKRILDEESVGAVQEKPFDEDARREIGSLTRSGYPFIFPDVMLASGASMIKGIEIVKEMGARNEQITAICVSAAPEGVHNLIVSFPGIKIIAYEMGGELNENAYIVKTGSGDAGDKFFQTVELDDFQPIRHVFGGDWWEYLAHQIEKAHAA